MLRGGLFLRDTAIFLRRSTLSMPRKTLLTAFLLAGLPLAAQAASPSFNVLDYGAVPDGTTMDTAAIARAIAACFSAHGGTVTFPAGRYLTGAIILESNITLDLQAGSELLYSANPADSPIVPNRWESTAAFTHAPLIYANAKVNIAVTGRGTLNGQGANWWWRNGRHDPSRAAEVKPAIDAWHRLYERIEQGQKPEASEFALAADYLRPSLVQFYSCKNVLVEGVTLTESPMWLLHPIFSENVSIRGVTFVSTGPNGDGIDVDSSSNVRISDCFFSTGDDCIVIKSGRDADGRRADRPTEHVTITNCVMYQGHGAVVVGSETSGGIRDVVASNIVARGTQRGIRIKSMRGRGNTVENLRFDNFVIEGATEEAIEITTLYQDTPPEPFSERTPIFKNMAFSNLTIVGAAQVASIHGLPEKSIEQVRFSDITAYGGKGFICDYSNDMELHNVRVDASAGSAFSFLRVKGLDLDGIASGAPGPDAPVVDLSFCNAVWVHASRAAPGTGTFISDVGRAPGELVLTDNDLKSAKVAVEPATP
jgi:polygalacturonase